MSRAKMQKNETKYNDDDGDDNDQLCVLRQLMEMFKNIPVERIRELCVQNNWHVERCVDELISDNSSNGEPQDHSKMPNQQQQQQQQQHNQSQQMQQQPPPPPQYQRGAIPKVAFHNSLGRNAGSGQRNPLEASSSVGNLAQQQQMTSQPWRPNRTVFASQSHNNIPNSSNYNNPGFSSKPQQTLPQKTNQIAGPPPAVVHLNRILDEILQGFKVMVVMRGPPGCGKSTLAKRLLQQSLPMDKLRPGDFLLSTDDFWVQPNGRYQFVAERLPEAHNFNQMRARKKAADGWSPIIIDNTNMQHWEMMPYVECAVRHGYIVELLEPTTAWRNNAKQLARLNSHGVPRDTIQNMLDRYEPATAELLVNKLNRVRYRDPIPQYRGYPPVKWPPSQLPLAKASERPATVAETLAKCSISSFNAQSANSSDARPAPASGSGSQPKEKLLTSDFSSPETPPQPQSDDLGLGEVIAAGAGSPPSAWSTKYATQPYSLTLETTKAMAGYAESGHRRGLGIKFDEGGGGGSADSADLLDSLYKPKTQRKQFEKNAEESGESGVKKRDDAAFPFAASGGVVPFSGAGAPPKNLLLELQEKSGDGGDSSSSSSTAVGGLLKKPQFERHSVDCVREYPSFVSLRQIYPNKNVAALWDLFVNCGGDIDWAIDIMLQEFNQGDDSVIMDDFLCHCESKRRGVASTDTPMSGGSTLTTTAGGAPMPSSAGFQPKPQRSRKNRSAGLRTTQAMEMKTSIENMIVIGEEYYSETQKKIRSGGGAFESRGLGGESAAALRKATALRNVGTQTEGGGDKEPADDCNANDLLEVTVTDDIISELHSVFGMELAVDETTIPKMEAVKVFVPRSLAKELYMLWIESVYNHMEEQRQRVIQEDEQFARLLKNPAYKNFTEVPSNLTELLDMEMALMIYNKEKEKLDAVKKDKEHYIDLATHLKQIKLSEMFTEIPRDTLEDILESNNNNYSDTVEMLMKMKDSNMQMVQPEGKELMKQAMRENELLNEEIAEWGNKNGQLTTAATIAANAANLVNADDDSDTKETAIRPEEGKRLALKSFENSRNLAAHHCQLKAECYYKAQEAIQKGYGGVAMFYAEIANLHKKKIEMYNHMAANAIVNVHKYTQNNPDLLDLHYLHVHEALGCLDLFLDNHITHLRKVLRPYKYVFVITGRGLHSVRGVSTIKTKVKDRLKDRNLRWSDVNPGLLKIKLFSASRHSKNYA